MDIYEIYNKFETLVKNGRFSFIDYQLMTNCSGVDSLIVATTRCLYSDEFVALSKFSSENNLGVVIDSSVDSELSSLAFMRVTMFVK